MPKEISRVTEIINSLVNQKPIPTNGEYKSTVGIYGYILDEQGDNITFLKKGGIVPTLLAFGDHIGDPQLRRFDDHPISPRVKSRMLGSGSGFLRKFFAGPKRSRGNPQEIVNHAQDLQWNENGQVVSLGDYYSLTKEGIRVIHPEIFTHSVALQDICRGIVKIGGQEITVRRVDAYGKAAAFIRNIHMTSGIGVGEINAGDILFPIGADGEIILDTPRLNLPDILYRTRPVRSTSLSETLLLDGRRSEIPVKEQKATDMLDFMFSIAFEEYRASQREGANPYQNIGEAMEAVVRNYGDPEILPVIKSFAIRGRLTFQGDEEVVADARRHTGQQALNVINKNRETPLVYESTTKPKKHRWLDRQHNVARFGLGEDLGDMSSQRKIIAQVRKQIISALTA